MLNSLRLFLKFIFKTPTSVDSPPLASAPQASVQVADPALRTGRKSSEVPFRLYKQNGLPPDVLVSAGLLGAGALMFAHNNHKRELNALRDEIQYIRNYQADINDQATLYEDLGERSFLELETFPERAPASDSLYLEETSPPIRPDSGFTVDGQEITAQQENNDDASDNDDLFSPESDLSEWLETDEMDDFLYEVDDFTLDELPHYSGPLGGWGGGRIIVHVYLALQGLAIVFER